MQFTKEPILDLTIKRIDAKSIKIGDKQINHSIVLSPTKIIGKWSRKNVKKLTLDDFKNISSLIDENVFNFLNVEGSVESKKTYGGTSQKEVNNQIKKAKRIIKEYGEGCCVDYYGLTPQSERQDNINKFQNDPKVRFFIGTPATGGYGITLTAASNMIYYSNGYDLEKRQQSEARIDRIGQKKPMTYIDILAEDTIDEKIVKSLRKKVNIATEIMGEELKAWI